MSSAKNNVSRATISMNLPIKVADLILYASIIVQKMTGNAYFVTPSPALTVLAAAIAALSVAETTARQRTKGAATTRNDKRTALVSLLQATRGYVQTVADAAQENGAAVIESAGFPVRKIGSRKKRVFAAMQGVISGSVIVTAPSAGPRSAHLWEYSVDGGKTWIDVPGTIQGKTEIAGLAAGTTVMFRSRALTPKGGQGDWTQPVTLLVK